MTYARKPIYPTWFVTICVGVLLGASVMLTLPGCDVMGPRPNIDSTADAILEGKANAKAYALLVSDLLTQRIITPAQAREQLEHLRTVQRELERAAAVIESSGDPFAATDRLQRVDAALALVLAFLSTHQEE